MHGRAGQAGSVLGSKGRGEARGKGVVQVEHVQIKSCCRFLFALAQVKCSG